MDSAVAEPLSRNERIVRWAMLPVLILAGVAGNRFGIPFLLTSQILFGSIPAMMVLQWYGGAWGLLAACAAAAYTMVLYNHPLAFVTFTVEAGAVWFLWKRLKVDLVVADLLFWFLAGMPFYFVMFTGVMHAETGNALFVLTKNAANQILNTLIARTLVILLSFTPLAAPFGVRERVSFRESLFTALSCFVMIPALAIVTINGRAEKDRIEREVRSNLLNIAAQGKGILDAWMGENVKTTSVVADALDPRALPPDTMRWLKTIRAASPGLLRLGIVNARGIILAHDPEFDELGRSNIGVDVSSQPFVAEVKRRKALVTSDVVKSKLGRPVPIVILAQPIKRGGEYLGYIGGVLNIADWDALVDKVAGRWDVRATVIDRNQRVIACNRDDVGMMQKYDWREGGDVTPLLNALWYRSPKRIANVPGTEQIRQSVYATEIPLATDAGWKLVIEAPVAPYQKNLYARYYFNLTLLLAIFAASLAGARFVARRTVKNIEWLDRISLGMQERLARREAVEWPESRIAETDSLIRNFRAMAEALSARFEELASLNETLERRVEERTSELERSNSELGARVEERLKLISLVENSSDLIAMSDIEGKVIYLNAAGQALLGFESPEDVRGRGLDDFFMPGDLHFLRKTIIPTGLKYGKWVREFRLKHFVTGKPIPVDMNGFVIRDPATGKPVAIATICRDIGDRKRLEEDLLRSRKLESLGVLAGGIAHDFNNLLTAILGNIALSLSLSKPGDETHRRLVEAEKASLRAQDLTQQLLTFSRGGAPVREAASIADLVSDSAGFALRGSNVRLDCSSQEGLWPAQVDPGQISQVVNNLIINASQAMPEGGTVTIRMENAAIAPGDPMPLHPGDYVKIVVADEGVGILPEHLERIFDPYFTTKRKGSGLGLATVYSIVKRHDGHVEVASTPGRGTVFTIWLPASPDAVPPETERREELLSGSGRVLVMDDEPFVRDVIGAMLVRLGYEPDFAEHGEEAIVRYRDAMSGDSPFVAVIMDLTIPGGMGGVEASQRLREIDPGVRIIVSSGYSNDPVMANYRDYGFVGVARKPFRVGELSRVLDEVLSA
jgi:PAS domain S-box-containing protein